MKVKEKEIEMLLSDIEGVGYGDLRTFIIDALTGIKLVDKLRTEYKNCLIIRNQDPLNECNNRILLSLQYLMEDINP